jgi:cytochrome c oxidase cbb3-type subunit III
MGEHKNPYPGENNTGHFWDDDSDIRELSNRPPRWYMWALYMGTISIVIYAFYYPSIPWFGDHNKGSANWTQIVEMEESVKQLEDYREAKFADKEKAIADSSLEEIVLNDDLREYSIKTAKVLFGDNCAACHGAGGQGNDGFPVLADDDWVFGGTLAQINTTITHGKKGSMPAKGMLGNLSDPEMEKLTDYVIGLSQGKKDPAGQVLYMKGMCMACHGPTGKPTAPTAANLTDGIWRFKADDQRASVLRTIKHGVNKFGDANTQNAEMPAFGKSGVINATQLKKLVVYVHQLGGGVKVIPPTPAEFLPAEAKGTSFDAVIAAADANYKKALDVNMAWRDTGKMIKEAKKTKDVALAKAANKQAENALAQAAVAGSASPRF